MSGIFGYVGSNEAVDGIVHGLKRLEYRGCRGVGVIVWDGSELVQQEQPGPVQELAKKLARDARPRATTGIGCTFASSPGSIAAVKSSLSDGRGIGMAVVYYGQIEQITRLNEQQSARNIDRSTRSDAEVLAWSIAAAYQETGDVTEAVRQVVNKLAGSFALAVMADVEPERIIAVQHGRSLAIGRGDGEAFLSSDIPALLDRTTRITVLEEDELATITATDVAFTSLVGERRQRQPFELNHRVLADDKTGYAHFMMKEIADQPDALRATMIGRLQRGRGVALPELSLTDEQIQRFDQVHLVGCGTAYHAGLFGKKLIEKLVRLRGYAEVASEYRYRDFLADERTLLILVSQSGETADTLAALREGKERGAVTLAVTNVLNSTIAYEADHVLYTLAGPEIAIASTKAYTAQLLVLAMFALYLAEKRGTIDTAQLAELVEELEQLPTHVEAVLGTAENIRPAAERIATRSSAFFIGRGLDYTVSLEGQLKLKETSYIHAEAYPAGELKHGPYALIENGMPVIASCSQPEMADKMVHNVSELHEKGAYVLSIGMSGEHEEALRAHSSHFVTVPRVHPLLAPIIMALPLQLLAYYTALALGRDVDQPRNLTKSVMTE